MRKITTRKVFLSSTCHIVSCGGAAVAFDQGNIVAWWRAEQRTFNSPYSSFLLEYFEKHVGGISSIPTESATWEDFLRSAAKFHGETLAVERMAMALEEKRQAVKRVQLYNKFLLPEGQEPMYEMEGVIAWYSRMLDSMHEALGLEPLPAPPPAADDVDIVIVRKPRRNKGDEV